MDGAFEIDCILLQYLRIPGLSYFALEISKREENYMRQVIRPFLNHLDAEKKASSSTIDTYRYDLSNSTIICHIG